MDERAVNLPLEDVPSFEQEELKIRPKKRSSPCLLLFLAVSRCREGLSFDFELDLLTSSHHIKVIFLKTGRKDRRAEIDNTMQGLNLRVCSSTRKLQEHILKIGLGYLNLLYMHVTELL